MFRGGHGVLAESARSDQYRTFPVVTRRKNILPVHACVSRIYSRLRLSVSEVVNRVQSLIPFRIHSGDENFHRKTRFSVFIRKNGSVKRAQLIRRPFSACGRIRRRSQIANQIPAVTVRINLHVHGVEFDKAYQFVHCVIICPRVAPLSHGAAHDACLQFRYDQSLICRRSIGDTFLPAAVAIGFAFNVNPRRRTVSIS